MKLSVSEFDKYARNLVSKSVTEEDSTYYGKVSIPYRASYLVDFDSSFNLKISSGSRYGDQIPLIKKPFANSPHISYGPGLKFIHWEDLHKKPALAKKYEKLFKDLPEINITTRDIGYASIYLTNKASIAGGQTIKDFSDDLRRISIIGPMTPELVKKGYNTLVLQALPSGKFAIKYSPQFIARTIVEDYMYHYAGLPGFENYKGAFTTLSYLIGHEILHYRNDHTNPLTTHAIVKLLYPATHSAPQLTDKENKNKLVIENILAKEITPFQELQNNALMSQILGVATSDMGVGRTYMEKEVKKKGSKELPYSGMYSSFIKIDMDDTHNNQNLIQHFKSMSRDKLIALAKNGWHFKEIRISIVEGPHSMKDFRKRQDDNHWGNREVDDNDIAWPIITPFPTDEDIFNLLVLFFMTFIPLSDDSLKNKPKEIKGYQIGDRIVLKQTNQRGTIVNIKENGQLEVDIDPDPLVGKILGIVDEIESLIGTRKMYEEPVLKKLFRDNAGYVDGIKRQVQTMDGKKLKEVANQLSDLVGKLRNSAENREDDDE